MRVPLFGRAGLSGLVSLAAAALLAACTTSPPPVVGAVQPAANAADGQEPFATVTAADYRLRPTDTIAVTVYREPDLSLASVAVGSDGSVNLPLIGSVAAAGRTPAELAQSIEAALAAGFLTRPRVSVNVIKYDSHVVVVEGAVKRPGVYPFGPGARLSTAIASAEGPDRQAKLRQVVIFRPTEEGQTIAKFDYTAIQTGAMIDPVLMPGDRVVVGTSTLTRFWQDIIQSLPAFALFTSI